MTEDTESRDPPVCAHIMKRMNEMMILCKQRHLLVRAAQCREIRIIGQKIHSEWGMDTYSLSDDQSDAARQQERHYYLLSELQTLVKDLPSSFQQRLSYTTLSDLAHALIDGTVYEIVQGLLDIQHLTEKNLYNQRQKLHSEHRALKQDLVRKHRQALQTCKSHNVAVLKSNQRTETEALEQRVREEQRMMDEKIIAEMDQKVLDQQNTLEKAGVSGFYITTNPQELMMQMNLLELILKLQQKEMVSGTLP